MKEFFIQKRIELLLSLIVGIIYVIPNLWFIVSDSYKGLPFVFTDTETMYLAKIQGAYKDCVYNCNPYISDYRYKFPHFNSSIMEPILATPGILTGMSVVNLKMVYEFLLPAILFLVVNLFIFRLTKRREISILGALSVVLGSNLINSIDLIHFQEIIDLFFLKTDHNQFLLFSRPVNPQFSSIFFFLYLHILLSTLQKRNTKWYTILGFTYGLLFHIYFFTYVFVTVVQGIWFLVFLIQKKWKDVGLLFSSILLGLIIGTPQFIQIYRVLMHPYYATIPTGYLIRAHVPDISALGIVMFLVCIVLGYLYIQKNKTVAVEAGMVVVLVAACFVVRNEHVVTGMIMQYDHFETYLFGPVFVMTLCFFISVFWRGVGRVWGKYIVISVALLLILNASVIQYTSYKHWIGRAQYNQQLVPVLKWLNNATSTSRVITAPREIANLIPVYTKHYVLWAKFAYQWMYNPTRLDDLAVYRNSSKELLRVGKKYNITYFVEEKKSNLLSSSNLPVVYEDERFIVYKNEEKEL